MRAAELVHGALVAPRRAATLARAIAPLLPPSATVLDLGAGDGCLASLIAARRPDVAIEGIDVVPREKTFVHVTQYDGLRAPFDDHAFDAVVVVDVLHHAEDPRGLFREAVRLARSRIVIKDHLCESRADRALLRFMDRVGNAQYGVALPYNYLSRREWRELIDPAGSVAFWSEDLDLYPWPISLLFDRGMHFVAAIDVARREPQ